MKISTALADIVCVDTLYIFITVCLTFGIDDKMIPLHSFLKTRFKEICAGNKYILYMYICVHIYAMCDFVPSQYCISFT